MKPRIRGERTCRFGMPLPAKPPRPPSRTGQPERYRQAWSGAPFDFQPPAVALDQLARDAKAHSAGSRLAGDPAAHHRLDLEVGRAPAAVEHRAPRPSPGHRLDPQADVVRRPARLVSVLDEVDEHLL